MNDSRTPAAKPADRDSEGTPDVSEGGLPFDWVPIAVLVTLVFCILIATVAVAFAGTAAAAPENATTTENETEPAYVASVDQRGVLKVVSFDYDGSAFTIELEAERPTLIVVSDLGGAVSGGGARQIEQERVTVPKGRSSVTLEASRHRGVATVSVATSRGAVALSSEDSKPLIGGNYTADDARIVGATSLLTGLGLVVVIFRRERAKQGRGPRRFL